MINHESIILALRAKLATLEVAATGSASLAASLTGFTRATGDFLADGFAPGMEVVSAGFTGSNSGTFTITEVTAGQVTVSGLAVDAADSGRTLTVGTPDISSENVHYQPTTGYPYFEETYLPGPTRQVPLGAFAELEVLPQYVLNVFVPENVASEAARKYVDKLLTLFAPGTSLTVSGHTVRVRRDTGPFVGPFLPSGGWAAVSVSVPLRVRTANSI